MEEQEHIELARPAGQQHSFDINFACAYGIEESILIHHFQYWIRQNKQQKTNFIDGRTWTYQTYKEISERFPYMSYNTVRRCINNLVGFGVILKANYNKLATDNTVWFGFSDESIYLPDLVKSKPKPAEIPDDQSDLPPLSKSTDPCRNRQTPVEKHRPIPDTKPNTKPNKKTTNPTLPDLVGGFSKEIEENKKIYASLEKINIPLKDKISFVNRYPEKLVDQVINFCTRPGFKIHETLEQSIGYYCLHPDQMTETKEEKAAKKQKEEDDKRDRQMTRKHYASKIRTTLWQYCKNVLGDVHQCPQDNHENLYFPQDKNDGKVDYKNENFKNMVEHLLRKFDFPMPEFLHEIP